MGDILTKGLLDTLLGMGVVFVLLIFMAIIIWSLKLLNVFGNNREDNSNSIKNSNTEEEINDEELVAVINAAIAASIDDEQALITAITAAIIKYEEDQMPEDGLIVRTMKKSNKRSWLRA